MILGLLIISGLGYLLFKRRKTKIEEEIEFTRNYREYLTTYLESNGSDMDSYSWLIDRTVKMQRIMGGFGKISYNPPFGQYRIQNQDIVIAFVPQIKKEFESQLNLLAPNFQTLTFYTDSLQEALIRFVGVRTYDLEEAEQNLKKTHLWFVLGFRQILSLPIYLFVLFGLLSSNKASSIRDSILQKIITALIFLVGVVSSLFTIILGWDEFWKLIGEIW